MSKSIVLALVVAVVIIGGIFGYITRDGIETEQTPSQSDGTALQTAQ